MRDGEQHKESSTTKNPFISDPINGYTAIEIATLQARLDKQLGPEYISHRSNGASGKVSYLEAFKVINLANEVFGFNGWSSEVRNITVDFLDEKPDNRFSLGLSVTVRVTLRDGTFHEDIGYGTIDNCRGKGAAFEKCKKEGTTDAMKRALRNFGNVLGNCLYDKTFLSNIAKVKVPATKFDEELLHRRPEFSLPPDHPKMLASTRTNQMPPPAMSRRCSSTGAAPAAREDSIRSDAENYGDDIFDSLDFEEDRPGNYDEMLMDETAFLSPEHTGNVQNSSNGVKNSNYMAPNEFMGQKKVESAVPASGPRQTTMTQAEAKRLNAMRQAERDASAKMTNGTSAADKPPMIQRPPPPIFEESVHAAIDGAAEAPANYQPSFMNSRTLVLPNAAPAPFDPKILSPSIPKSGLADHNKSTPIKRPGLGSAVAESPSGNGASPLRRMGNALTGSTGGHMLRSGSTQFRAPSKLNQTLPNGANENTTSKRGSEALAEHPHGAISMNLRVASDGGNAEKRARA